MSRIQNILLQLRAERWPMQRLEAFQFARLKSLVNHSYQCVPFYRELMNAAGIRPEHIRSLGGMHRLPLVDKAMMRAVPETERISRPVEEIKSGKRIHTGGTSGEPFGFLVDKTYNRWRKSQYLRPYLSNGRRPFKRLLHLCAFPDAGKTLPTRIGLLPEARLSCTGAASEHLEAIRRYRPHLVQGYPSSLRALALEIRRTSAALPPIGKVFSDSEMLTPDTRRLVESTLRAPVLDVYGSLEADNIGYECWHQAGMHLALDSVFGEVVDGDRVLPHGETGELVITILHNHLTPFIRYRTGDIARMSTDPCPCGRTFPLLQLMGGRQDDMLRLADGRSASPLGLIVRFDDTEDEIAEFKISQTAVHRFTVRVVPAVALPPVVIKDRVRALIQEEIPASEVNVEVLERIPRTRSGKLQTFVCQMDAT